MQEFKDDEVGLVIKSNIAKNSTPDREDCLERLNEVFKEFESSKCSLYLLHGEMSDEEIDAIYKHPKIKAMVSTTHGEGFGLLSL